MLLLSLQENVHPNSTSQDLILPLPDVGVIQIEFHLHQPFELSWKTKYEQKQTRTFKPRKHKPNLLQSIILLSQTRTYQATEILGSR